MRTERKCVFETNSSSTHALVFCKNNEDYVDLSNKIIIDFVDTDFDGNIYGTLKEKVSYLVGFIIHKYKYNCYDYADLIEQVKMNYDYKKIEDYVMERYGKEIVFPKEYKGELEDIVNINHQLLWHDNDLDSLIMDMLDEQSYLDIYFDEKKVIEIGRD